MQKQLAWWARKQGLDGSRMGHAPAAVLAATGWARSVGGAAPYLTLFARAGTGRAAVEAAVANQEIYELPSARGCTYVVPASDFALALKVGQPASDVPIAAARKHLGVTDQELEALNAAVLDLLASADQPLLPNQLREACGGAIRNLGDAGKKRGLSTTLPLALGYLQAHGHIRRVPVNGRLDQQRYGYVHWDPNPLNGFTLSLEEAFTELARRYFQWIGPATLQHFQWFSGLGAATAKAATAPLGLVPIEPDSPFLVLPDDRERFLAFEAPAAPRFALVSSLDGLILLRRDLGALVAQGHRAYPVFAEKGGRTPVGGLVDAPCHLIVDRGQVIGFWEYDPDRQAIAWRTFAPAPPGLQPVLETMETFAREELGDVRSFSLDTPASRAPKLAWLREE